MTTFLQKRRQSWLECVLVNRKQRDKENVTSSVSPTTRSNIAEVMTYYWRFSDEFGNCLVDLDVRVTVCNVMARNQVPVGTNRILNGSKERDINMHQSLSISPLAARSSHLAARLDASCDSNISYYQVIRIQKSLSASYQRVYTSLEIISETCIH